MLLPFVLALTAHGGFGYHHDGSARADANTSKNTVGAAKSRTRSNSDANPRRRKRKQSLVAGTSWGGRHISLKVTETGAAVEYDCGHGTIAQRVELDKQGHFDVSGTYENDTAGPSHSISAEDGTSNTSGAVAGRKARYAGRITGRTMTLSVNLADTGATLGTFKLTLGAPSRLYKCQR